MFGIVLSLMFLAAASTAGLAETKRHFETLVIETRTGRHKIAVEVAETEQAKALGLMFRTEVPAGTGMLFPYNRAQEITMWMRNTYVSLDMIFIKGDGTVHHIVENAEPMSEDVISSNGRVTTVLELAAGQARRYGIRPGDRVEFRTFSQVTKRP